MSTLESKGPEDPERTLQSLMRSMADDAPRPAAKQATLAALGLGAAATTAAGTAGALGGVAGTAKLLAVGALSGILATGVVVGARRALAPAPPDHAEHTATSRPAPPVGERLPAPQSVQAVPFATDDEPAHTEGPPQVPVRVPRVASHPSSPDPRSEAVPEPVRDTPPRLAPSPVAVFDTGVAADSSLRDETAGLDRARSAIAAGNARRGLAELDRHDAAFPHGALAPEAELLRIKALVMTGDGRRAKALARAFVANNPASPHLDQLGSLLEP